MPGTTLAAAHRGGEHEVMRYESSVTSVSWIPSEAMGGMLHYGMDVGPGHYDDPLPDVLGDLHQWRAADRFRFANQLRAWIDVDSSGRITRCGYADGGGVIGSTTLQLGSLHYCFQAVALPDLRKEPEHGDGWVRFTQTAGGRTGVPMPRRVRRRPYVQWNAPLAWTTLSLTLHADGRAEPALAGASRFPRHWVYDASGQLFAKSGLIDFGDWYRRSFGRHTPWGDQDSPALVTTVETALERALSAQLMHGAAKAKISRVKPGTALVRQGEPGTEIYLILDGVVWVERDGERLAEYGPGALLGERAHLEGGARTSSVIAVTGCRVASAGASQFSQAALAELAGGHRREGAT
jgi:Cyclic nucleotide-binding domain